LAPPYLRLLYETQIIALQNPAHYGAYLQRASTAWQRIAFDSMSESLRSTSLATLCIAVFDGLMLELMATGDRRRLSRALDEFIALSVPDSEPAGSPRAHEPISTVVS
jgi:hypothetical protein